MPTLHRDAPAGRLTSLIFELRHAYQHRRPLEGVIARFEDGDGVIRAQLCLIDVTGVAGNSLENMRFAGVLPLGERLLLLPDRFQRTAMAHGASVVNYVLSAVEWPDSDWLAQTNWDNERQREAALEAAAGRQFGALHGR